MPLSQISYKIPMAVKGGLQIYWDLSYARKSFNQKGIVNFPFLSSHIPPATAYVFFFFCLSTSPLC